MAFRKIAVNSVSWATMGFALTGAAFAQGLGAVGNAGGNAGIQTNNGQVDTGVGTDTALPESGANASTDANLNRNGANANLGTQTDGTRAGANANADGTRAGAAINADGTRAGAQIDQNGARANGATDVNGTRAGGNAGLRRDGLNADGSLDSNVDANVNGTANRADIGQQGNLNASQNVFGATFDTNITDRLVIRESQPNSAAARLGLRAGDRIIGFNGQSYTDAQRFNSDLAQWNGNTRVPLVYERDGRRFTENFQMSSQHGYGHQGQYQSNQPGQTSHSVGRPYYESSGSNGFVSGVSYNQSNFGGDVCCGGQPSYGQTFYTNSYQGHACCDSGVRYHHQRHRHHRRCR